MLHNETNNPAIATVVNFGVSFLHLNVTEKTEKLIEDVIPNMKPIIEFFQYFQLPLLLYQQLQ